MYISLNWLKDFVKMPAKISPLSLKEELTNHTVEVEGLVNQAEQFAKVVVGRVLSVEKHPNADRLRLAVVDIKKEKLNIVCGAPNLAAGQLVPVALIGAILPNGVEIKAAEIRGYESHGMICAEDELGLGKNHEGIIVLSDKAKVGEPFAKYLQAEDIILEVDNKSLSNRPDLLNHYGLAREISAIFDLPLKPYDKLFDPDMKFPEAKGSKFTVKVDNSELCPRYLAVRLDNIKITESPAWLKQRLIAIGQRPINNIVDLTNYVMFDCGQPMHAFDADKVSKIVVRRAKKDEVLETLDEKERILSADDLVITDGKQAIALAGIIGGRNSEIGPETNSIVLESANFSAAGIRKTSQRLGLRTEASIRFEKSLDPNLPEAALYRFLALLKETCPEFKATSALIDIDHSAVKDIIIDLNLSWLTTKIGLAIPRDSVTASLEKIGFSIVGQDEDIVKVKVPSWRATKDISAKEDLAEEILRLYGYDNIPSQLPTLTMALPEINQERVLERKVKEILSLKHSLSEAYNYSFVGEDQLNKLNIDFSNYLGLANPLSGIQSLLRQSLVPGLAANLKTNQARNEDCGFFEVGSVFFKIPGNLRKDQSEDGVLPYQEKRLGIALSAESGDLFGRLKGLLSNLFQNLLGDEAATEFYVMENIPGWADKQAVAKINVLGQEIGLVALIGPGPKTNLNLKKLSAIAELNFNLLIKLILSRPMFKFQEVPKYPPVRRDLAFVVDDKILYNDLRKEMLGFNPLIRSVELFDVYSGDKLPAGQKSLAFHLNYQSEERTLTAAEVDKIQNEISAYLLGKFEAKIRNF